MHIALIFMNEYGDIINCLCVPSPQSNRNISRPLRTATAGRPLSLDGMLAPVPKKRISNISICDPDLSISSSVS